MCGSIKNVVARMLLQKQDFSNPCKFLNPILTYFE
jgi:hypothetical protein